MMSTRFFFPRSGCSSIRLISQPQVAVSAKMKGMTPQKYPFLPVVHKTELSTISSDVDVHQNLGKKSPAPSVGGVEDLIRN